MASAGPCAEGQLLCRCRGLTLGGVRRALAAGAGDLGQVRAFCAAEAPSPALQAGPDPGSKPEPQAGAQAHLGEECCTARLAALIRAHQDRCGEPTGRTK